MKGARAVRGTVAAVARVLRWSLIGAIAVMLACVALQVVMRYGFGRPPAWTEELAVLMFAWCILGALALGVHEGYHVGLTFLVERLPPGLRPWAGRVFDTLTAALGAYLVWSGWRFVAFTAGSTSAAVGYPIEFLHVMAPITGALVFLFALERASLGPAP